MRWLAISDPEVDSRPLGTRSQAVARMNLKITIPRCDRVRNSFMHKSSLLWNMLPTEYHIIRDDEQFKSKLRMALEKGELDDLPAGIEDLTD